MTSLIMNLHRISVYESIIKDHKSIGTIPERLEHLSGLVGTNVRTHWQKWSGIFKRIKEFLDSLWEPVFFLDFETFYTPIPPYNGTRPYQQIPFQYSIHYLKGAKSKLGHYEFLAEPNKDPRKDLVESLLNRIPPEACILAYYAPFEKKILKSLEEWFPRYHARLKKMIDNLRDLQIPFKKRAVYHWRMKGSSSLKSVLPALIRRMDYDALEIYNGEMATRGYFEMCQSKDPKEIKRIRRELLDYCKMDTLAMVELNRVLFNIA
jgi:hypothetical protein